jgi:hypothetical protein
MERRQRERRVGGRRRREGRRRRTILVVVVGLLVAVPVWTAFSRILGRRAVVPSELIGVWTTTASGYADRALEFTRSSVLLHSDEYHFTVHPIRWVTRERHSLYTTFRIEYQDVDAVTPLVFRFIPSPRPLIRLEHFASVWRRELPR